MDRLLDTLLLFARVDVRFGENYNEAIVPLFVGSLKQVVNFASTLNGDIILDTARKLGMDICCIADVQVMVIVNGQPTGQIRQIKCKVSTPSEWK